MSLDSNVSPGKSWNKLSQGQPCPRNCIGVVLRLSRPRSDRYIAHFAFDLRISLLTQAMVFLKD